MKNQKGITLIALTITIIALILTVAILSIVSQFFYSNKEYLLDKSQYVAEYNKFNMSLCQRDCTYVGYNTTTKNSNCKCKVENKEYY